MEPVSLTLGAIVAALIAGAQNRVIDVTLDEGEGVLRRLLDSVRKRFSEKEDKTALGTLELVEKLPDSAKLLEELAGAIEAHAADPAFRAELEELVGQANASGINVRKTISQVAKGDGNVQIADVSGQIHIGHGTAQPPRRPGGNAG